MPSLYLTPASINYLSQFILVVLITIYLGLRRRTLQRGAWAWHGKFLFAFFLCVSLLSLALFLDTSLLATVHMPVVYVEATLLSMIVFTLIQFAYSFLASDHPHPIERGIVSACSLACGLYEAGFAVWRFYLLSQGTVIYRPEWADIFFVAGFLWVIFVFARGAIENRHDRGRWRFALIFFIPFWLTTLNLLNTFGLISTPLFHINVSVGILFCLFFFAINYLSTRPEITTLATRISGVIITSVVAVFGALPWLVTPAYAARYSPAIIDQRTLRFTPNQRGGYTISHVAFHFDQRYGTPLSLIDSSHDQPQLPVDFVMPFYGQTIRQVVISDDGMLGMGAPINQRDLESGFAHTPAIFPLLVDLNPEQSPTGGIFVRHAPDQLLITYLRMQSSYYSDQEYTFQVLLRTDGSFEITYNGLPTDIHYTLNHHPGAAIWAIGAKPAQGTPSALDLTHLPLEGGPEGSIADENRSFRLAIHQFLVPFTIALLLSSLFFLVALPLTLHYTVLHPLTALTAGVEALENGQHDLQIPVQANDEIGFLTSAFNTFARELNSLIGNLEAHVATRTADLIEANERLQMLSFALEQNPSSMMITDLQGRIEYVNAAFIQSSGYSFAEVLGQNPRMFKSDKTPPAVYREMWTALRAGQTWRGELRNRRKNGEEYWELTIIAPMSDDSGTTTHYVALKEDLTARKLAEEELERLTRTDPLTGISNRRHFFAEAEQLFARAQQPPYTLTALMLDIDHFKRINDTYGHQAGDQVIQAVAQHLQRQLRSIDLLARYGGEEFVVLLPRTFVTDSSQIVDRIIQAIRTSPVQVGDQSIAITLSAGIAHLSDGSHSLDELLNHADQALYQAKQAGRDRWVAWKADTPSICQS